MLSTSGKRSNPATLQNGHYRTGSGRSCVENSILDVKQSRGQSHRSGRWTLIINRGGLEQASMIHPLYHLPSIKKEAAHEFLLRNRSGCKGISDLRHR